MTKNSELLLEVRWRLSEPGPGPGAGRRSDVAWRVGAGAVRGAAVREMQRGLQLQPERAFYRVVHSGCAEHCRVLSGFILAIQSRWTNETLPAR